MWAVIAAGSAFHAFRLIGSLIPRRISQTFTGYAVKKPRTIPTCISNQYAAWSGSMIHIRCRWWQPKKS